MSISWTPLLRLGGARRAWVPGEHHGHQLDPFAQVAGLDASRMNVSWTILLRLGVPGEHHEHQQDTVAQIRGCQASIMSISRTLLLRSGGARQAS